MYHVINLYVPYATDCPNGMTRFEDGCLKVINLRVNWNEARTWCKQLSGRLVSVNSEMKHDHLVKLLDNTGEWTRQDSLVTL